MKKTQEEIKNDTNTIVDICLEIIKQNNIIVYPSSEAHSVNTDYKVKIMNENRTPADTIFIVLGPSNGYGVRIIKTDVYISCYDASPYIKDKIMKLYYDCEKKSDKQKPLRAKIAEQEYAKLLAETKQGLANLYYQNRNK